MSLKVTKCTGEGQGSCTRCNDNGKWNRSWMCFLYKVEGFEGCYCSDCVKELQELQEETDAMWRAIDDSGLKGVQEVYYSIDDDIIVVFGHRLTTQQMVHASALLVDAFIRNGFNVYDIDVNGVNVYILKIRKEATDDNGQEE